MHNSHNSVQHYIHLPQNLDFISIGLRPSPPYERARPTNLSLEVTKAHLDEHPGTTSGPCESA